MDLKGFDISLANEQAAHTVDESKLIDAARAVLADSGYSSATISLAVVDDETIHELNRRYLAHDYPTDVLSFVLDDRDGHLNGEVILSADTAAAEAAEIGWPAAAEQVLYVIHGMLHLVGYRDKLPADAARMREAERRYLSHCGIASPTAAGDS
jgi:probable rRNA maturation factor